MQKEMIKSEKQPLPFQKKNDSNSSKNSLQESFEMTSLSSDSEHVRNRNSMAIEPDSMTNELNIHTSMQKGYEESK